LYLSVVQTPLILFAPTSNWIVADSFKTLGIKITMTEKFSNRFGYQTYEEVEIAVREDAPHELRGVIVDLAYDSGFQPSRLRSLVCRVLMTRPDENNWSEFPNIDSEVRELIDTCKWYEVYDIIESIYKALHQNNLREFEERLNRYFEQRGIGWKINDGLIVTRGDENFEKSVGSATSELSQHGFPTANRELHEALVDLSRRPEPDITGSIQHSMAALECVAREVSGQKNSTLGEIIKRNKNLIPSPLDSAVSKAWGYASENARHVREGGIPSYAEAELVVGICASVCSYLIKINKS
jgi:hypothetical protein